ncbi:MAG: MFS transporter [Gammaproteobacteria bacterium]|nr:MAG: MFS transporter [Gammaproteobacteria bacterium]
MTRPGYQALDRLFLLFTRVQPGEARPAIALLLTIFILLLTYYLLKPVREALILTNGTAELRSYAIAAQGITLAFIIPVYSYCLKRWGGQRLVQGITLFFALNLLIFYGLLQADLAIGFLFFIWLGIFSVMVVAQFWAMAADLYKTESGLRMFAPVAVGGSLGAVFGSQLSKQLYQYLGTDNLLLLACATLILSLLPSYYARRALTKDLRNADDIPNKVFNGFRLVMKNSYLLWIAVFVIILNWINSTGEYLLARFVTANYLDSGISLSKAEYIGQFYGDFYSWVNILSLGIQLFLVSRLFRWIGVGRCMLVLPLIAVIGYGLMAFFPVFTLIKVVKILENSTDYSLQNTTRHALFLPLETHAKYAGKTTIDTFFWRFGDLIQALFIFAGTQYWQWSIQNFALFNFALAIMLLLVAIYIKQLYKQLPQTA